MSDRSDQRTPADRFEAANPAVLIREARHADAEPLVRFQLAMAWETEALRLDQTTVTRGVRAVFDDASKGCYLVAEVNERVVGGLLLTYEWSDWRNGQIVWIQSVYVEPEFRRRGIFRALFAHVRNRVQHAPQYVGLRLYVERNNHAARRTYEQLGMTGDHYDVYEWFPGS